MIKPIRAIIRMLQGKIILQDGTDVRIVKREYPIDKTPCITIDNSGGTATVQKHITNKDFPLPETHPQYTPGQTQSQQVIREERTITLNLHVWCDDEDQREEICNKIQTIFYQIQSDHYTHCIHYHNGGCNSLNGSCQVNPSTMRGVKQQCPKPREYGYTNIFTYFDIIRASFDAEPSFISDDLTTTPPVLRSIIPVSFSYYEYYNIGGAVSNNLIVNEELL